MLTDYCCPRLGCILQQDESEDISNPLKTLMSEEQEMSLPSLRYSATPERRTTSASRCECIDGESKEEGRKEKSSAFYTLFERQFKLRLNSAQSFGNPRLQKLSSGFTDNTDNDGLDTVSTFQTVLYSHKEA